MDRSAASCIRDGCVAADHLRDKNIGSICTTVAYRYLFNVVNSEHNTTCWQQPERDRPGHLDLVLDSYSREVEKRKELGE